MVDVSVTIEAAWDCHTEGRGLADVLLPVHFSNTEEEEDQLSQCGEKHSDRGDPVLLQRAEEGSPCLIVLRCSPGSLSAISRLLVISEARTIEVYGPTGEYWGTGRGERDDRRQTDSSERGPFYRKQLILESPSSSCELKLLSLAGRDSVLVCRIVVGLQTLQPSPARGLGIDMQQVQSLVDEMGTSLSPGAQNLMDMVQFQQKNQTGSLGGLLPLLMGGGALSSLIQGANIPGAAFNSQPLLTKPQPSVSSLPADESPPGHGGGTAHESAAPPMPGSGTNTHEPASSDLTGPVSPAHLAEMMSHFLNSQGREQVLSPGPELLPMLQSVCGQVTKLRLDDAAVLAEKEKTMRNGSWELDSAMERRLEEMEKRLKEHVDRRLDALEQKLEKALLSALNQGAMTRPAGDAVSSTPPEQATPTPAVH